MANVESRAGAAPEGPAAIMQMFQAAHASAVLIGACQLNVFAQLGNGARDAASVATGIGCPERSTRILLDALVALGLLGKDGETYRLAPLAEAHLVPGTPAYMGDFAGLIGHPTLWGGLGRLAEAVRAGGTVLPEHAETPKHPFWEVFARSSASMAGPAAMVLEGLLHDWIASRTKACSTSPRAAASMAARCCGATRTWGRPPSTGPTWSPRRGSGPGGLGSTRAAGSTSRGASSTWTTTGPTT